MPAAADAARARRHDRLRHRRPEGRDGSLPASTAAIRARRSRRSRRRHRENSDAARCRMITADAERLLLGPGPSPVSPRVMRAMAAPVLSHLDPEMMAILDDVRARLAAMFQRRRWRVLRSPSPAPAPSGMEAAVANLTRPGTRAVAVVTGYFGDRLAQMLAALRRDGHARRRRVGTRARSGAARARARRRRRPGDDGARRNVDGRAQPGRELCRDRRGARRDDDRRRGHLARRASGRRRARGAPTSSTAARRRGSARRRAWRRSRSRRARATSAEGGSTSAVVLFRSELLEDYWVNRKYHHTISRAARLRAAAKRSSPIEEEGLEARWDAPPRESSRARRRRSQAIGLELLPPPAERLWSLNAVDGARRRRRGARAQGAARRARHRDRRRPRSAGRQDLARRADGLADRRAENVARLADALETAASRR